MMNYAQNEITLDLRNIIARFNTFSRLKSYSMMILTPFDTTLKIVSLASLQHINELIYYLEHVKEENIFIKTYHIFTILPVSCNFNILDMIKILMINH